MPHPLDANKPPKHAVWSLLLPIVFIWMPLLLTAVYSRIAGIPLPGLILILALSALAGSCLTVLRYLQTLNSPNAASDTPADPPTDPQPTVSDALLAALEQQLKDGGSQTQLADVLQQLEDTLPQVPPNTQRTLCLQVLQTYLCCTAKAADVPGADGENTAASANQQLFRMIRHTITNLNSPPDPDANAGTQMQTVLLEYVDRNCLDSSLCLNSAADYLNTSIYAVSRIFKDATGVGFKEYITGKRLQYACHLLETTRKTVSAIAAESGFENSTYFTTVFKNEYGVPPSKYRANAQRPPEGEEP